MASLALLYCFSNHCYIELTKDDGSKSDVLSIRSIRLLGLVEKILLITCSVSSKRVFEAEDVYNCRSVLF
ncbi:unnamed protein product [Schistosoma margrebowiei]|uniref:Uncharacterized protein n=1 Tax=Schistosoma margrebowiei TaxID=48269 RepID=A0AA84ZPL5_9TREM|nr:unnamed protein product [Schistosoma margrebowiei]